MAIEFSRTQSARYSSPMDVDAIVKGKGKFQSSWKGYSSDKGYGKRFGSPKGKGGYTSKGFKGKKSGKGWKGQSFKSAKGKGKGRAPMVVDSGGAGSAGSGYPTTGFSGKGKGLGPCFVCGRMGHRASQCYQRVSMVHDDAEWYGG
jgi:hypothetical protein